MHHRHSELYKLQLSNTSTGIYGIMESMNWEHRHLSSLECALEILIDSTHYCTNNFSMTSRKFKSTHSNSNISQLRKDNVYKN